MRVQNFDGERRRLLGLSLLSLAVVRAGHAVAAHPPVDFGALIDAAGRQRMLTQRIVKAYCQAGLNVATDAARAQLGAAVDRFDRQLARLNRDATTSDVRKATARLAKSWTPFRQEALGPVSREGARRLALQSESLLAAANDIVHLLQHAAGTPQARLVNIAGRQRMLSQRLAKLYLLRTWKIASPGLGEQMDAAAAEFEGALATLRAAPENTPAIATELEAVAMQWEWFRSALELEGAESHPYVVTEASEAILGSMELVTAKYAALARGRASAG